MLPLVVGMVLGGLSCIGTGPVGELLASDWPVITLACLGKFFICLTYAVIYQVGSELYPTPVRGLGIGFSSLVGAGCNAFMPYIIDLAKV